MRYALHCNILMSIAIGIIYLIQQDYMLVWDPDYRKMNVAFDLILTALWVFIIQYPTALVSTDSTVVW